MYGIMPILFSFRICTTEPHTSTSDHSPAGDAQCSMTGEKSMHDRGCARTLFCTLLFPPYLNDIWTRNRVFLASMPRAKGANAILQASYQSVRSITKHLDQQRLGLMDIWSAWSCLLSIHMITSIAVFIGYSLSRRCPSPLIPLGEAA
ncbi:hypothetical protein BDZ45DRAFT_345530 [Acephala macrosclerotiorum]|nr:hypothetical protein BDZ45DRAFT_345530 [Acephala macrosclerotiorum]